VPDVVDPSPVIEARLQQLAAEHEPTIRALEDAVANAAPAELKGRKRELKQARSAYAQARRQAAALRGPGVTW
jgi:hypothetical protein